MPAAAPPTCSITRRSIATKRAQVQGVFAAARDVTERKRMEEELRVASLYARSLLEASLDPLVTISPDGKITDVNEATGAGHRRSARAADRQQFSDYFTEPDKAARATGRCCPTVWCAITR